MNINPLKVFLLLLLCTVGNIFAGRATDLVQKLVKNFDQLRIELARDFSQSKKQEVSKEGSKLARAALDFEEIGRLAMGKHYQRAGQKNRREIIRLFKNLLTGKVVEAQIPEEEFVRDPIPFTVLGEYKQQDDLFDKQAIVVKGRFPYKRVKYEVEIFMYKKGGALKIYDVHIEGSSYLLDFKNQFARVIKEEGYKGLIERLSETREKVKASKN